MIKKPELNLHCHYYFKCLPLISRCCLFVCLFNGVKFGQRVDKVQRQLMHTLRWVKRKALHTNKSQHAGPTERSELNNKHIRRDFCLSPLLHKVKRLRGACGDLQIAIARRTRPSGIWNPNRVNEHLRVPHRKKVQTNIYTEVPCKKIKGFEELKRSWAESNLVQEKLCNCKRNTTSQGFNGDLESLNKSYSDLTPFEPRQVFNKPDLREPLFQTQRSVSKKH